MTKGKYLGIDFGDKRVGIAISDFNKEISFPRDFLEYKSTRGLITEIKKLCEEEQITKIVLGLPIQMDGTFGERAIETQKFFDKLKKHLQGIDIDFFDERLSTEYASKALHKQGIRAKEQKGKRDTLSAQIILQNYLNSLRSK
ncbi:Holliday junction resolvase RuvX [Patescibacteria group bacterium]|nr:Holliday junction resolvase RuvX [Patescibacteria group bacterium]MBU1682412.1 Holliday junction resolvase RuvX [Patescibacteria group bacterium]MBU1934750.1 Holliday junction resolvase RuvX [Patescibacteria group bacterium]